MSQTKIDWADEVWNPVWGCKRGCAFKCYAKGFHRRFAKKLGITNPFKKPTWIESNFQRKLPNKPKRIFVGSMSDIEYWEKDWMQKVLNKIEGYPQHTFLFLTKHPISYIEYIFPKNCWLGVTIMKDTPPLKYLPNYSNLCFISYEPLLSFSTAYYSKYSMFGFKWIIIGGLTPKSVHKNFWIDEIIDNAKEQKIPVFLKDNLHYPKNIQEFPI